MKYSSPGPALLAAGLLFCTLFAPFGAYADNKKDELSAKQNQAQQAYNEAQQELEELQNQQSETQSQIEDIAQVAQVVEQVTRRLEERMGLKLVPAPAVLGRVC